MIKKNEIVKKSEAKIIVFLKNATGHMKRASNMSRKLSIDYIYLMKYSGKCIIKDGLQHSS